MGTSSSGLTFFEPVFSTAEYEGLADIITGFDASGGGAIQITPGGGFAGRRRTTNFFTNTSGQVQRRNPSSTGNLTPTRFTNIGRGEIKIFRTFIQDWTLQDWEDLGLPSEMGQRQAGLQFGAHKAENMMTTALSAVLGSLGAIGATAKLDISAASTPTLNFPDLNNGFAKHGDRAQEIVTLFMHSKPWHDLIGDAIVNREFAAGALAIFQGTTGTSGRIPVVTDIAPLLVAGSPNKYNSLALVRGAVEIEEGNSERRNLAIVTGDATAAPENLLVRLQIEWSFTLKVRGMSWKAGSADNPDDSTLADATKWDLVVSSHKLGPGIFILSQ